MGNQGFQGDARAQVQSSIVQERNKTAISYLNATNTSVRLRERVLYANLRRDTGVTPSVTSHLSSTARLPGENTLISQDSRVPGSSSAQRRPASTAASPAGFPPSTSSRTSGRRSDRSTPATVATPRALSSPVTKSHGAMPATGARASSAAPLSHSTMSATGACISGAAYFSQST